MHSRIRSIIYRLKGVLVLSAVVAGIVFLPAICGASPVAGLAVNKAAAYNGYTLFAPNSETNTYLINNAGEVVHTWPGTARPGHSVYLLEDGTLLRTEEGEGQGFNSGGQGGKLIKVAWDGTIIWEYDYFTSEHRQHHDVEPLPNGNILMIAWEVKNKTQCIAAGRNPDKLGMELWPDTVIEIKPTETGAEIVWEWHVWDHLIQDHNPTKGNYGNPAEHPELVDINFTGALPKSSDWNHTNGMDYNAELDQIVLSIREFNEIWVIDHSTTTAEAAGHSGGKSGKGGDLLYRWGNPQAYRQGSEADRILFHQHDARWIPQGYPGAGNLMVFNNGPERTPVEYSSVDTFTPPLLMDGSYAYTPGTAYGPAAPTWTYTADPVTDFYSSFISGAHRLPNGNTLICSGSDGTLFEVTQAGEVVWKYVSPFIGQGEIPAGQEIPGEEGRYANQVFRAERLSFDYPGLATWLSGWWYDANAAGTGVSFEQRGTKGFLAWYVYDAGGNPVWYAAWVSKGEGEDFSGTVKKYTGRGLNAPSPGAAAEADAGSVTVTFHSSDAATFVYDVDGTQGTLSLTRYLNDLAQGEHDPRDINGWWWDERYSGLGWFVEAKGGTIFAAWYNYRQDGTPRWWVMGPASFENGNASLTAAVTEYTNGQTLGGAYSAPDAEELEAGVLNFNADGSATFSFRDKEYSLTRYTDF